MNREILINSINKLDSWIVESISPNKQKIHLFWSSLAVQWVMDLAMLLLQPGNVHMQWAWSKKPHIFLYLLPQSMSRTSSLWQTVKAQRMLASSPACLHDQGASRSSSTQSWSSQMCPHSHDAAPDCCGDLALLSTVPASATPGCQALEVGLHFSSLLPLSPVAWRASQPSSVGLRARE